PAGISDTTGQEKIIHEGPYIVNLMTGNITPSIRWVLVEPGRYRRIEFTAKSILNNRKSLMVKGVFRPADRSGEIPFEITTSDNYDIGINSKSGVEISNNGITN